mmetsp:Transcript_42538/g.76270  ORF Transcript_42538/g.76270 Transcript_42538/m.76270 type:complete len:536 (+) Transcript_42538:908-2515(+)|eukprot:CAMPEP_0177764916 /NCGR_PEP_ID=MMETSP0491_2-20121128/7693_1 /TAXON_ID=63592 /ORGANISM="Tetraselmis chuii, Strain PLY429" /LENGTH=535 /DNA_ID=CAMNT_0019281189 /DNA_START=3791 /DNA_END=5398 /DNA_ORIENTATION=+
MLGCGVGGAVALGKISFVQRGTKRQRYVATTPVLYPATACRSDGGRVYVGTLPTITPSRVVPALAWAAYTPRKKLQTKRPPGEATKVTQRRSNSWNDFQRKLGGKRLSMLQMRERYQQERRDAPRCSSCPERECEGDDPRRCSWNEFQQLLSGCGLSSKQRAALFWEHRGDPSAGAAFAAAGRGTRGEGSPSVIAHNVVALPTEKKVGQQQRVSEVFRPIEMPRLGYACSNGTLRAERPSVYITRGARRATFEKRGLPYVSNLALCNCRDLFRVLEWNEAAGIPFFRLCIDMFPWADQYAFEALPDFPEIRDTLNSAGEYARSMGHRLTCHPAQYVKLASPDAELQQISLHILELHSQLFDLLGYSHASPENKINIHVGGVYGNKPASLARFASALSRLSPHCRARLTIENDDSETGYSIKDLIPLSRATGVPLVFDFHHHRFNNGGLPEREALLAIVTTWPEGVRPVVHWSESQEGRRPHAHADLVAFPIRLHGLDSQLDVMLEAKGRERAVLEYRRLATVAYLHDIIHPLLEP